MASGIRWTQEDYIAYIARSNRASVPAADVESDSKHGPETAHVDKAVHTRFRIHVHSRRRRLTDPDGVSAKAAIDGLVAGGLLEDDSAKYIESVTFTQELAEIEETVIDVEIIG